MVNILILDDRLDTVSPLKFLLADDLETDFGIPAEVRLASTVEEAETHIGWTDVAIVDKNLDQHQGGFDFINRLKRENPTSLAILYSGEVRKYASAECAFDVFVSKFDMMGNYRVLTEPIAAHHHRQNQPQQSEIRTPLERYLEDMPGFQLQGNYPESEIDDVLFERLAKQFGKGNVNFGDAFDENGNLISYEQGLRGVYIRRIESREDPA